MKLLSIGEVSAKSGVTVRALRHYENIGLLAPKRTQSQQRVYALKDINRLQQIQTLKRTGLSLAQIKNMINNHDWDALQILDIQKGIVLKQLEDAQTTLSLIDETIACIKAGSPSDLSTFCHIIKMGENAMSHEKWQKVWDKFYTKEEQERWAAAKTAMPEEAIKANEQAWPALIAKAEALVGTDPKSPEAQAVATEWHALMQPLLSMDPALAEGASKLYDNMDDWPKEGPEPPFSKEVWAFIQAASAEMNNKA